MRQILRHVGALERLRLSSLDCVEIDDELFAAFAEEPRLMPHLHLSLQAGDDLILKRMKRRHSRAASVALCERLRRLRPVVRKLGDRADLHVVEHADHGFDVLVRSGRTPTAVIDEIAPERDTKPPTP